MRTNPKFWSDGFQIVDDPDSDPVFEGDLEDFCVDDAHLQIDARRLTPWQQLENRLSESQMRIDLGEWDYWDEYLAVH